MPLQITKPKAKFKEYLPANKREIREKRREKDKASGKENKS